LGGFAFEGVSTYDIAPPANTALSSITYHFGGKGALCLACADPIADHITAVHAVCFRPGPRTSAQNCGGSVGGIAVSTHQFRTRRLAPPSAASSQFIARELQPIEAFERLHARNIVPVIESAVGIIPIARVSLDHEARRVRVITLVGMALVLRLGRAFVSRATKLVDLTEDATESLIGGLRRSALALLTEA
jgi:AcrR family transcriptional regulator